MNLKQSPDRVLIVAKGFRKRQNLHLLIKQNILLLQGNLALVTFGELLIVFSVGVRLLYPLYLMTQRCCLLYLIRPKIVAKKFSENSNLDDSEYLLPAFSSKTNLKLHNISVTPEVVQRS